MSKTSTQSLSQKKKTMPPKMVMGLMVAAISVLVGTASVAGATPGRNLGVFGYGGINIDLGGIIGNNNVIIIIINYFMGR